MTRESNLARGLDGLLPSSKEWLLAKGYISRCVAFGEVEYSWTEEGYRWVEGLITKQEKQDV